MSHPLALSFCVRSTPITLVLLSFSHNRSLSLYSPLLNWSILHLNHDISTLLQEKEGENKYKRASYFKRHSKGCFMSEDFKICWKYNAKNWVHARVWVVLLFWFEVQSLTLINTHLNWGWENHHNISSHQNKANILSQLSSQMTSVRGHQSDADRGIFHIYSAEFLH